MARERTTVASAINVALVDPKEGSYIELFKRLFRSKSPIPLGSSSSIMLTSLDSVDVDASEFTGTFARFTEIDLEGDWFDIERGDKAEDSDVDSIVIPPHLRPNYIPFFFEFDVKSHLFTFQSQAYDGSVSEKRVEKFLRLLVDVAAPDVEASINLVSSANSAKKVYKLKGLRRLHIHLELPNPDDLESAERRVKERLRNQNARIEDTTLTAIPGQVLNPDKETKTIAKVAASNGYAASVGRSKDGVRIDASTRDIPMTKSVRYDPDARTEKAAFTEASHKLIMKRNAELARLAENPEG